MKKLFFALALVFTFQSIAMAMPEQSLKSVYQDFLYARTVEWNQIDADHLAAINARFADDISALKEKGLLTESAVKELFEAEMSAGRVPQEIYQEILTADGQINFSSLASVLDRNQDRFFHQGASWEGEGKMFFKIAAWGFLPALIIIAIITTSGRKEMCTNNGAGYDLYEPYPCN